VHDDGSVGLYAHMRAVWVRAGALLARGDAIGEVGHTGLAHGDHLHFEWRRNGQPDDPMPRFDRVLTGRVPREATPAAPVAPSDVHGESVNDASRPEAPAPADTVPARDST
jgi:murein DD-endopeptidase MepM/ murein hydrolase activator NlpD